MSSATTALTQLPKVSPKPREDETDAGIGGMAKHAIRPTTNNPLARLDCHLTAEVTAQAHDRPVSKRSPYEDNGEPQAQSPPVVGVNPEAWDPRSGKGRSDGEVEGEGDNHPRPAVLAHRRPRPCVYSSTESARLPKT